MRLVLASVLASLLIAAPVHAGMKAVDVALVLAPDVSGSVTEASWRLQRDGMAAAISTKKFHDVVRAGPIGRIAVSVVQWSGLAFVSMEWRVIETQADAEAVAAEISKMRRNGGGNTCMDSAVKKAMELFRQIDGSASRQVIDISGDGEHNCQDRDFSRVRQEALSSDITINGLPIVTPIEPKIESWYEKNVIGGPGAFIVTARGFDNFKEAFLKKVTTEIAEAR